MLSEMTPEAWLRSEDNAQARRDSLDQDRKHEIRAFWTVLTNDIRQAARDLGIVPQSSRSFYLYTEKDQPGYDLMARVHDYIHINKKDLKYEVGMSRLGDSITWDLIDLNTPVRKVIYSGVTACVIPVRNLR